ncbi:30S ribosomal protein S31, mitochondrial-like [Zingiber officinale]|uniref:30S ribosomal protein S31, mitochondrial-like n=1 Tax=Zingiber officinale TaxID=94328 RepID=UPI001C4B1808|nr:30S ribosomal protein S31, mitochondrial-like [Zingiber officinale]
MAMLWLARTAMRRVAVQQPAMRSLGSLTCASFPGASVEAGAVVPCGRGDKKTKRGKRFKGSYGNARGKRKTMIQRIKDRVEVPRSTPWPLPFKLI